MVLVHLRAAERVWAARDERWPVANEVSGKLLVGGITLRGTADRVDQAADGTLAIVDYKTGAAPSAKSAGEGLNSQLGLLGLIAEEAGLIAQIGEWALTAAKVPRIRRDDDEANPPDAQCRLQGEGSAGRDQG